MTGNPLYSFENHHAEKIPSVDKAMASVRTGLEARYADRFTKFVGTSAESIRRTDDAKRVADELRTSAGVIDTQAENVNELFAVAEMMVKTIDDFQRESGRRQVNNVPLASDRIRTSHGLKLGYVKMCMKFMNAGLLHFMEQSLSLEDEVKERNNVIKAISEEMRNVPILGRLQEVDLNDLATTAPIIDTKGHLDIDSDDESIRTGRSSRDSGIGMDKVPPVVPPKPVQTPVKRQDSKKEGKDEKDSKKKK